MENLANISGVPEKRTRNEMRATSRVLTAAYLNFDIIGLGLFNRCINKPSHDSMYNNSTYKKSTMQLPQLNAVMKANINDCKFSYASIYTADAIAICETFHAFHFICAIS